MISQQYASKFWGELNIQRKCDLYEEITIATILIMAFYAELLQPSIGNQVFLSYWAFLKRFWLPFCCQVTLLSMSAPSFLMVFIPIWNLPLWHLCVHTTFNVYFQYTICMYIKMSLYALKVFNIFAISGSYVCYNFMQCVCTGQWSIGHSSSIYKIWTLTTLRLREAIQKLLL